VGVGPHPVPREGLHRDLLCVLGLAEDQQHHPEMPGGLAAPVSVLARELQEPLVELCGLTVAFGAHVLGRE
jgi:hypothetical protein